MEIEPRPLRGKHRPIKSPQSVIKESWEQTFRALDHSVTTMTNQSSRRK